MSAGSGKYIKGGAPPYSESAAAQDAGLGWGKAVFRGNVIDVYGDPNLIYDIFTQQIAGALPKGNICAIADFGSGDGHVAQTVVSQLKRLADCPVLPICIDYHCASLRATKQRPSDVQPVLGNLLHLPFALNSFQAGILRFALPFISKAFQPQALKQIYDVLKPGAVLVVLNYGVLNETEEAHAYDRLFAGGSACEQIMTHNPSCESLMDMAKAVGFTVKKKPSDLTDTVVGYLSPKIYADLYNLNERQQKSVEAAFKAEKDALPFEAKSLRVRRPMYGCVFKKEKSRTSP